MDINDEDVWDIPIGFGQLEDIEVSDVIESCYRMFRVLSKTLIYGYLTEIDDRINRGYIDPYEVAEIADKVAPGLIEKLYAADYALQQERDNENN